MYPFLSICEKLICYNNNSLIIQRHMISPPKTLSLSFIQIQTSLWVRLLRQSSIWQWSINIRQYSPPQMRNTWSPYRQITITTEGHSLLNDHVTVTTTSLSVLYPTIKDKYPIYHTVFWHLLPLNSCPITHKKSSNKTLQC